MANAPTMHTERPLYSSTRYTLRVHVYHVLYAVGDVGQWRRTQGRCYLIIAPLRWLERFASLGRSKARAARSLTKDATNDEEESLTGDKFTSKVASAVCVSALVVKRISDAPYFKRVHRRLRFRLTNLPYRIQKVKTRKTTLREKKNCVR